MEKEYWVCIVGTTYRSKLRAGADAPMRNAVRKAFVEMTGEYDEICSSGWGNDQKEVDVLNAVWSMDKSDPIYKDIVKMLRDSGRIPYPIDEMRSDKLEDLGIK